MNFTNTKVMNFEGAFRGMRNPMNSWALSDSDLSPDGCRFDGSMSPGEPKECKTCPYFDGFGRECLPKIGENDLKLAQRLIRAGTEHRKFMRQIMVCVDITAPLYWWKEFDTYKVGTTANSTSTMHKIASSNISLDSFETDDMSDLYFGDYDGNMFFNSMDYVNVHLEFLNMLQRRFNETNDFRYWKELIRWLPESWQQTRTVTLNYENLLSMCRQRKGHKLVEWEAFRNWAKSLPCAQELIFFDVKKGNDAERDSA